AADPDGLGSLGHVEQLAGLCRYVSEKVTHRLALTDATQFQRVTLNRLAHKVVEPSGARPAGAAKRHRKPTCANPRYIVFAGGGGRRCLGDRISWVRTKALQQVLPSPREFPLGQEPDRQRVQPPS